MDVNIVNQWLNIRFAPSSPTCNCYCLRNYLAITLTSLYGPSYNDECMWVEDTFGEIKNDLMKNVLKKVIDVLKNTHWQCAGTLCKQFAKSENWWWSKSNSLFDSSIYWVRTIVGNIPWTMRKSKRRERKYIYILCCTRLYIHVWCVWRWRGGHSTIIFVYLPSCNNTILTCPNMFTWIDTHTLASHIPVSKYTKHKHISTKTSDWKKSIQQSKHSDTT